MIDVELFQACGESRELFVFTTKCIQASCGGIVTSEEGRKA